MPRHDHEYVAAPKTQVVACDRCGCGVEVGTKRKRRALCVPCAVALNAESITQMYYKRGPIYQTWARGMRGFVQRIERGDGGYEAIVPNHETLCEKPPTTSIIIPVR